MRNLSREKILYGQFICLNTYWKNIFVDNDDPPALTYDDDLYREEHHDDDLYHEEHHDDDLDHDNICLRTTFLII